MKLVIEINESKYERLKFLVEQGFGTDIDEIIVNATPLTDCTDAISRSAVIEMIYKSHYGNMEEYVAEVKSLPSVNANTEIEAFLNGKKCGYEIGQFEKNLEWRDKLERIRAEIIDNAETKDIYSLDGTVSTMLVTIGVDTVTDIIADYLKGGE